MTPEAFLILTRPFKNKLYRLCLRLLADSEDAADALQETYMKLWIMKSDLSNCKNLEAFAMTVARNHCLDQLKAARQRQMPLENLPANETQPASAGFDNLDTLQWINKFVGQLPEMQRTVFQLRDIEQCGFEEIAEVTGLKPNAIRTNLSRARKKIREQISKHHQYEYRSN